MNIVCEKCGSDMEVTKGSLVTNIDGQDYEVDNVEAMYCEECGYSLYTQESMQRIRREINSLGIDRSNKWN